MRWIAGVVLAVAVSGCGGGSSGAGSPTTTPTSSPPAATATAAQYASIVASSETAIRQNARQIKRCAVSLQPGSTCGIIRLTATLAPKTLLLRLRGAMQSGSQAYLGRPPAEVAALVTKTMSDARAAARTARSGESYMGLTFAQGALVEDLDAWRPYGG